MHRLLHTQEIVFVSKISELSRKLAASALCGLVSTEALSLDQLPPEGIGFPLPDLNDDEQAAMCAWLRAGGLVMQVFLHKESHPGVDSTLSLSNIVITQTEKDRHAVIAVEVNGMTIVNPFLSECGNFMVDPVEDYGISVSDAREIVRINTRIHNYFHSSEYAFRKAHLTGEDLNNRIQSLVEAYVNHCRTVVPDCAP